MCEQRASLSVYALFVNKEEESRKSLPFLLVIHNLITVAPPVKGNSVKLAIIFLAVADPIKFDESDWCPGPESNRHSP